MFTFGNENDWESMKQDDFLGGTTKGNYLQTKDRSLCNFIDDSLSVIAAYCSFEKKPAIDVNFTNDGQLTIF